MSNENNTVHNKKIDIEEPLIETRHLKKYFHTAAGNLHAVDDVSLKIYHGTTLGVVGESGCGKSTLGRTIIRLIEPTSGEVLYKGENLLNYNKKQMFSMKRKLQLVFQDPYASLNPRMTVSDLIAEPLKVCKIYSTKREIYARVDELMEIVGLDKRFQNSYPHELDGGRRQRIGVARALSVDPEFIVCDEPVSALDVSIQAQILNLMMDLQEDHALTYMFITHDLSVVRHISDHIAVMYLGQLVEFAPSKDLFKSPMHPYTQALLDAIPVPSLQSEYKLQNILQGEVSNPIEPPAGCRFAARCKYAMPECSGKDIPLKETEPGHFVTCALF